MADAPLDIRTVQWDGTDLWVTLAGGTTHKESELEGMVLADHFRQLAKDQPGTPVPVEYPVRLRRVKGHKYDMLVQPSGKWRCEDIDALARVVGEASAWAWIGLADAHYKKNKKNKAARKKGVGPPAGAKGGPSNGWETHAAPQEIANVRCQSAGQQHCLRNAIRNATPRLQIEWQRTWDFVDALMALEDDGRIADVDAAIDVMRRHGLGVEDMKVAGGLKQRCEAILDHFKKGPNASLLVFTEGGHHVISVSWRQGHALIDETTLTMPRPLLLSDAALLCLNPGPITRVLIVEDKAPLEGMDIATSSDEGTSSGEEATGGGVRGARGRARACHERESAPDPYTHTTPR